MASKRKRGEVVGINAFFKNPAVTRGFITRLFSTYTSGRKDQTTNGIGCINPFRLAFSIELFALAYTNSKNYTCNAEHD